MASEAAAPALVANFTEGSVITETCRPVTVTVSLFGEAAGGVPPYDYAWNFGDLSAPGQGPDVQHTYGGSGTFNVTLTVSDARGAHASITRPVIAPPPPCAVGSSAGVLGSTPAGPTLVVSSGAGAAVAVAAARRARRRSPLT